MLETCRNLAATGYKWEDQNIEEHCKSPERSLRSYMLQTFCEYEGGDQHRENLTWKPSRSMSMISSTGPAPCDHSVWGKTSWCHSSSSRYATSHSRYNPHEHEKYVTKQCNSDSLISFQRYMKKFILEKNVMNVNDVGKPSDVIVIFKYMKKFTLEKNPMCANNVVELLDLTVIGRDMNKLILKTDPLYANSVADLLTVTVILNYMKKFILETDPLYVQNVAKLLDVTVIYNYMKKFILETDPLYVKNVVKPLYVMVIFRGMKQPILEKNPMDVNSVGKPSV
ncbi:zinc finger protein 844 isoform X1, partial [Cricetulus griseus]|uniref:zinc finger protein 844 isoform X1 n=1 Tax=Cricetulus griseus TaxID=10029 RepID=UPI0004546525